MGIFKRKEKPLNSIHPDLKKLVVNIGSIKDKDGKIHDLYEFKTLHDMPARRYAAFNDFLEDKSRGIEKEELEANIKEVIDKIELNEVKGITDALIILRWMHTRMKIHNDLDLILRIISVAIFFKDEDLTTYDWDIGTRKIELFEEAGVTDFFLSEPIKRFLKSINISKLDMDTLLEQRRLKKQFLDELKRMGISFRGT